MAILLDQPNGQFVPITTGSDDGVPVLAVTTLDPDTYILVPQPNGEWAKLGTRLDAAGIPTLCVRGG